MDQSKLIEIRRRDLEEEMVSNCVKTFTNSDSIREALQKMMDYPFEERPFLDVIWSRSFNESDYQDFDECTFILFDLHPSVAEFREVTNYNMNWGVSIAKIRRIDIWSEVDSRNQRRR